MIREETKKRERVWFKGVDPINFFTSRPKCIPGSMDPGITIVNPTEISVMYGYIHWRMTTEISVMYGSEEVKAK